MDHYAGIDVSLEYSSVCVVAANGKIVREHKVASEPEALIAWFGSLGLGLRRIGLEAGPLSQWLYAAMRAAESPAFAALKPGYGCVFLCAANAASRWSRQRVSAASCSGVAGVPHSRRMRAMLASSNTATPAGLACRRL